TRALVLRLVDRLHDVRIVVAALPDVLEANRARGNDAGELVRAAVVRRVQVVSGEVRLPVGIPVELDRGVLLGRHSAVLDRCGAEPGGRGRGVAVRRLIAIAGAAGGARARYDEDHESHLPQRA